MLVVYTNVVAARSDCTDRASLYDQTIITLDCPAGCDAITDRLWGTGIYTEDSYVCAAAIHDGRIIGKLLIRCFCDKPILSVLYLDLLYLCDFFVARKYHAGSLFFKS